MSSCAHVPDLQLLLLLRENHESTINAVMQIQVHSPGVSSSPHQVGKVAWLRTKPIGHDHTEEL